MKNLKMVLFIISCSYTISTSIQAQIFIYSMPGGPGGGGTTSLYNGEIRDFTYPASVTNRRNISLRVLTGYIAYISFREDFPQESIFIGDHPNFGSEYPNDIQSIRVVRSPRADLNFCGFSTQIHNNDCRRIFGTVKIRFLERLPSGVLIPCPRTQNRGTVDNGLSRGDYSSASMFIKENVFPEAGVFGTIANLLMSSARGPSPERYVFANDGSTVSALRRTLVLPNGQAAGYGYTVSQDALREDRIVIEFVTNLGDHHKSNDLALDYSSNVSMQETTTTLIPYQSAATAFSIGDFELKGNPNSHHGMASGVRFSILKSLRIHFNKERTAAPRR